MAKFERTAAHCIRLASIQYFSKSLSFESSLRQSQFSTQALFTMSVNFINHASAPVVLTPRAIAIAPLPLARRQEADALAHMVRHYLYAWEEDVLEHQAYLPRCYDPSEISEQYSQDRKLVSDKCHKPLMYAWNMEARCTMLSDTDEMRENGEWYISLDTVECFCKGIEDEPLDDVYDCIDAQCSYRTDRPDFSEYAKMINRSVKEKGGERCRKALEEYQKQEKAGNRQKKIWKSGGLGGSLKFSVYDGQVVRSHDFPRIEQLQQKYNIKGHGPDTTPVPTESSPKLTESTPEPTETKGDTSKPGPDSSAPGIMRPISVKTLALLGGLALYFGCAM